MGTILGLIVAFVTIYFQDFFNINPSILSWVIFSTIFLVLALFGTCFAFAYAPLQKVEQNFTPRLLEMFRKDNDIRFTWYWTLFFIIISLFLIVAVDEIKEEYLFAGWIIGFGISLDVHRHMVMRILKYFNPFDVIKMFTAQAIQSIQKEDETKLCNSIDALSEVAVKSIDRNSMSLCQDTVDELRIIAQNLLKSAKSISHPDPEQSEETVSFTLFYLFQRLEMIHGLAIDHGLEPVSTNLINNLGKIAVEAAKCDLTYLAYPIHYMGRFARDAQDEGMEEVGVRGSIALTEVARRIVKEVDLNYGSIREPFLALIGQLEELNKEMFRQDKTINIMLLKQPFIELRKIFENERVANHQDTPAIRGDIDRVIGEFTELEAIMNQMPPMPVMDKEGLA